MCTELTASVLMARGIDISSLEFDDGGGTVATLASYRLESKIGQNENISFRLDIVLSMAVLQAGL